MISVVPEYKINKNSSVLYINNELPVGRWGKEEDMEMKKKINMELKNRAPEEVR